MQVGAAEGLTEALELVAVEELGADNGSGFGVLGEEGRGDGSGGGSGGGGGVTAEERDETEGLGHGGVVRVKV